jgi:hypothetical protein
MKALIKTSVVLAATVGAFFACSKEEKKPADDAQTTVELSTANAINDRLYEDVLDEVNSVNLESGLYLRTAQQTACRTITVEKVTANDWPKKVTVDYGTGCTAGVITRKGKIIYTISNKFLQPGSSISVSFEGYSVNDYKLEGVFAITNTTTGNTISFTTQTTAGKLTYPDGKWFTYVGQRAWTQTAGNATPFDVTDDEYTGTGNGTLTSSTGNVLAATIKTGLVRKVSCVNVVSGVVEGTFNNIPGSLDFGSGTCDKNAVLTVANKTYQVTLP